MPHAPPLRRAAPPSAIIIRRHRRCTAASASAASASASASASATAASASAAAAADVDAATDALRHSSAFGGRHRIAATFFFRPAPSAKLTPPPSLAQVRA